MAEPMQAIAERPPSPSHNPMQSVLRATSLLTASWLVTLAVGLASSKVLAVVLNPSGFGYYGLLQSFVELVTMVAGMGIGAALVRSGASRVAEGDQVGIASLRQGSWLVFGGTGTITVGALIVFRKPLSQLVLGSADHGWSIAFMAAAVLLSFASYIQVNTLNAYHRVSALARYGAWSKVLGASLAIAIVAVWRQQAIVGAVIATAVAAWLPSHRLLNKEIGPLPLRPPLRETLRAARSLLSFGAPFMGSTALGRGVQLILPMLVLHLLGADSVGNYRAASTVAVTYLGFLATAMVQDYFPRVSAMSQKPRELANLVNEQHKLVLLLSTPVILATLALVPWLVPLVYSSKFNLAVEVLEWLLIGDIFKIAGSTMSIVVIARCSRKVFFLTELLLGVTTVVTSWLGARWFGLAGLGMAFLASHLVYYLVVWVIVVREVDLALTATNKRLMLAAVSAAFVIRVLPFTALSSLRMPLGLMLAAAACAWSAIVLGPDVRRSFVMGEGSERLLGVWLRRG